MEVKPPSFYEIACHFCVSHITGATIPATRLSKILDTLFHEKPLTPLSLKYLQQQNLPGLYLMATGRVSYQDYLAALDPALVSREQASRREFLAKEAERLAQEQKLRLKKQKRQLEEQNRQQAQKAARAAQDDARRAEFKREQQAAEAARLSLEAAWQEQGEKNRKTAEAAYRMRMEAPGFQEPTAEEIAKYFRIRDPKALTSPLSNILNALYQGRPLSVAYLNYLKLSLRQLHQLAIGQTTYLSYISDIDRAEAAREQAEATRLAQTESRRLLRQQPEAARIARKNDPAYIARKKHEAVCRKYGSTYSDQTPDTLLLILDKLDSDTILSADEYAWLISAGKRYYTDQVKRGYHRCEAIQCISEFNRTQAPWNAINGSAHYRKCDMPAEALDLLDRVKLSGSTSAKLKSALLTTRGGVMRDLHRHTDSISLGEQAHKLTPKNFRPCTLLGAVNMELGNYSLGHEWYQKALERGATEKSVDSDLKRIYRQANKTTRENMKAFLLAEDPIRFGWVKDQKT